MPDIDAILFDLDDTLLANNMDSFLSQYFALLTQYVRPMIDHDQFMKELLYSTQAMIQNQDPDLTNREVFWSVFCSRTSLEQKIMEPLVDSFYREQFPALQSVTGRKPVTSKLIKTCFDHGLKVVIATNPLFPRRAIEHRLDWAGVPVREYDYVLVTTYENMHSAKPATDYYREILTNIDVRADRALMVGDDWENDMVPASQVGLFTYWISEEADDLPESEVRVDGRGSLDSFYHLFNGGWLLA